MQKIHFSCTACGQRYTVRANMAGKKVKCRHCQTIFFAPAVEAESAKAAQRRIVATEYGEPGSASHQANAASTYKLAEEAPSPDKNRLDMLRRLDVLPEQPAGNKAVLENHADGLTITVPPAGIWRGSEGLFAFGLVWLTFTLLCGGLLLASGRLNGLDRDRVLIGGSLVFHLLLAVGLLLGGINMGTRRAVFVVAGETLTVLQTGIFGSKRRQWKREQLADIRTGPSAMGSETRHEVGADNWTISWVTDRTDVIELQILLRSGKKVGMLAGHEIPELEWIAAVLQCALWVSPDNSN